MKNLELSMYTDKVREFLIQVPACTFGMPWTFFPDKRGNLELV